MSGQTEGWANVCVFWGEAYVKAFYSSAFEARIGLKDYGLKKIVPDFRIHVRLKPEGAPRRYASENDRKEWEWMARGAPSFLSPRSPKTEESAS